MVITPPKKKNDTRIISTSNLTAHWKLDNLDDSWFNDFDLTNNGSVTFNRAFIDKGAKFDGSTQYLTRAHTTLLNPKISDFFFLVHIRGFKGGQTNEARIISKMAASSTIGYRLVVLSADGNLRFEIDDGTDAMTFSTTGFDVLDGKEHIIIVTVDRIGAIATIYVDSRNAKETLTIPALVGSIEGAVNFAIGARDDGTLSFEGHIGEVRIYYRLPTAAEIDLFMNAKTRYIVGTEEQGGSIKCKQMEPSSLNLRINGQDATFRALYETASEICALHEIISLDKIRAAFNFHTLDDESINDNDLILQADSHVARIKLDGDVLDSVSNNDGTVTGTETYVKDVSDLLFKRGFKKAGDFGSGKIDRITLANESNFDRDFNQPFSISNTIQTTSVTDTIFTAKRTDDAPANAGYLFGFVGATGLLIVEFSNGTTDFQVTGTKVINDGLKHVVTMTFAGKSDRKDIKIYVDGVLDIIGTALTLTGSMLNAIALTLGASNDGTSPYTGQMNNADFFNSELSADQVKALSDIDSFQFAKDGGLLLGSNAEYYDSSAKQSLFLKDGFSIFIKGLKLPATQTGDVVQEIVNLGPGAESVANIIFRIDSHSPTANRVAGLVRLEDASSTPAVTFVYTPDTEFDVLLTWDKTTLRMYIDDGSAITATRTGLLDDVDAALSIGSAFTAGNKLVNGGSMKKLRIWERVVTTTERTDLFTGTLPDTSCMFDGIIMDTPTDRKTNTPFNIVATDYLYDRLNNEYLTRAYPGDQDVGDILANSITKTSLLDDFVNPDVERLRISSLGKYFIRESMLNVFKWATKAGGSVFYSKRRGSNRYIFHHKMNKTLSGLTINKSNIRGRLGSTLYKSGKSLHDTATSVEVEGGVINTNEETQTFDNGTNKATDTLFYAFKVTPEFIRYGQLELKMSKQGSPSPLRIEIREDKAGDPAGPEAVELASVVIDPDDVPSALADADFVPVDFDIILDTGKTYWVTIFIAGDATNRYRIQDNGGTADTSTETSPDDAVWTPVGYTLVYKWSRKEPILSLAKDSTFQQEVKVRKLVFKDEEITDKATAKIIAKGILERVGKKQVYIQGLKVKGINIVPIPGESIIFNDDLLDFNSEQVEVQQVKAMLRLGKEGAIDQLEFVIGDKIRDPSLIFTDLIAAFRNSLTADQQVITDTKIDAESLAIGILSSGNRVPPVKQSQKIGITGIVSGGDPPSNISLPRADMIWDIDDIGGGDVDAIYDHGMMDEDDVP